MPDGNGGWKARITTPDGRRPWVPIPDSRGKSKAWAKNKAEVYTVKAEKGGATFAPKRGRSIGPAGATIKDVGEAWVKLVEGDPNLTPSTRAQHKTSFTIAIDPKLGALKPDELTTATIRRWVRELVDEPSERGTPKSASTIRNRFNSLSKMIDDAIAEEWITTLPANPCRSAKVRELLPAVANPEPDEIAKLTEAQASTLLRATAAPDRRLRYLLECTGGLRDGEAYALRWSSLDDEDGVPVMRIRESLAVKGPEGFGSAKAPKTRSSKRTIPLHPLAIAELKVWHSNGWRALVGRAPNDSDPILPGADGTATRTPKAAERFRADLAAAKLSTTFHDEQLDTQCLRRSFATWLEARSVPGDHIDRLMGHARQSVRGRHYSAPDYQALARGVATIRLDLKGPTREESGPRGASQSSGESSGESSKDDDAKRGAARNVADSKQFGEVAKWLGNGLQSAPGLPPDADLCRDNAGDRDADALAAKAANPAIVGRSDDSKDDSATVEKALATALERASAAGAWSAVEALARELGARRAARDASNVIAIDRVRRRGK